MFNLVHLITSPFGYYDYICIEVLIIRETSRAILIQFDCRRAWFPKSWILGFKQIKNDPKVKIKISRYYWAKKFG